MARSHVISAMFLTLVSANMIQGGIPQFYEETFPNFMKVVDIRRLAELFHNTALSSASTFNDFKTHFDNIYTDLKQIPLTYRFVHGEKLPNLGGSAGEVPSQVVAPRILGNYGGVDGGAASATSSAASEALAKRRVV